MELSEKKPLVLVKFCGGCNPLIDRQAVFNELKELLFSTHQVIAALMPAADWFLIISGCRVNCAGVPKEWAKPEKTIRVAGTAVNGWLVNENELADAIARIITGLHTINYG